MSNRVYRVEQRRIGSPVDTRAAVEKESCQGVTASATHDAQRTPDVEPSAAVDEKLHHLCFVAAARKVKQRLSTSIEIRAAAHELFDDFEMTTFGSEVQTGFPKPGPHASNGVDVRGSIVEMLPHEVNVA